MFLLDHNLNLEPLALITHSLPLYVHQFPCTLQACPCGFTLFENLVSIEKTLQMSDLDNRCLLMPQLQPTICSLPPRQTIHLVSGSKSEFWSLGCCIKKIFFMYFNQIKNEFTQRKAKTPNETGFTTEDVPRALWSWSSASPITQIVPVSGLSFCLESPIRWLSTIANNSCVSAHLLAQWDINTSFCVSLILFQIRQFIQTLFSPSPSLPPKPFLI